MKRQLWEVTDGGERHRVEVTGEVVRTLRWWVEDELVVEKRSMEDKLAVTRQGGQTLRVRYSSLGAPRRASLYADHATALVRAGGVDLVPEEGSRAALWERRVIEHPRRHTLLATVGAAAGVVVPILLLAVLLPLLGRIPWPDVDLPLPDLPSIPRPDLPSIPWPDITLPGWLLPGWVRWVLDRAPYVVPIVIAFVVARSEVRRRRQQLVQREERATDRREQGR